MIRRIKWKDHPVLGNLELDFTKKNREGIYNTIVLIGENGSGKTSILESLNNFLNNASIEDFDYIEYSLDDNKNNFKLVNNAKKEAAKKWVL